MSVGLIYLPVLQFLSDTGVPLPGARLFSFLAGTSTPAALYADSTGGTPLANPAVADDGGKLLAYGVHGQAYKLNLLDANGVQQVGWPVDHILLWAPPAASQLLPPGLSVTTTTVPLLGSTGDPRLIASGALPAMARILFVELTVTQGFGSGQGAVSLALGDPGTLDRWGSGLTLGVGVKPMRDGGTPMFPTATDLVLSTEGGVYDGTGQAHARIVTIALT